MQYMLLKQVFIEFHVMQYMLLKQVFIEFHVMQYMLLKCFLLAYDGPILISTLCVGVAFLLVFNNNLVLYFVLLSKSIH